MLESLDLIVVCFLFSIIAHTDDGVLRRGDGPGVLRRDFKLAIAS